MKKLIHIAIILNSMILFMFTIGLNQLVNAKSMSPGEENKVLLKRLIDEGYNQRDISVVDEIVDSNYVEHTNGVTAESSDIIKQTISWLLEEAPDFKITIEDMIVEGEKVTMRWIYRGKNQKFYKQLIIHGVFICRFKEGKIIEGWQIFDNLSRYKQLGYTITPPSTEKEK